jgi:integrase/recombinase XerD
VVQILVAPAASLQIARVSPDSRGRLPRLVRRRAADAGIETPIGCHTFRATGITDYRTNGGRIEVAQKMAGHSNAKTTGLYDRRNDDISVGEVEKIGI